LTNLNTYTCTVTATNGAGTSDASAPSGSFVPAAVPDPPTGLVATADTGSVSVAFTPPADNGSPPISSYSVSCTSSDGGGSASASGASSPVIVSGLTNVRTYTCAATATNDIGTGLPSAASNAVVPEAVPTAPTLLAAVAGNAKATLNWTTPSNSASAGITGYVVTGYVGYYAVLHQTFNSTATTQVIAGLTNGKTYAFRVAAANTNGTGAPSAAMSAGVIGAPKAPTGLQATAGTQQATLHFRVAGTNGSPVTGYVVTVFISGTRSYSGLISTASMTTLVVQGLTTGKHYSFKIAARNARGVGPQSAISNVVTPT
jgi:predicted phage tail protein